MGSVREYAADELMKLIQTRMLRLFMFVLVNRAMFELFEGGVPLKRPKHFQALKDEVARSLSLCGW